MNSYTHWLLIGAEFNDLECQKRGWGFMDFLAISGCDTSLYHSQGGATLLSLCDLDREFDICILTLREHHNF